MEMAPRTGTIFYFNLLIYRLFLNSYLNTPSLIPRLQWSFYETIRESFRTSHTIIAYFLLNNAQTSPTIFSFSLGLLSAINSVNAVKAGGVIRDISNIFAWRRNQTNA
ncbi:MAG: hypothetical protein K0S08_1562 [Gammaproteobacteria bacterium]|nr:hypothetical protein [Gammaproteobacteria bacterium]